MRTNIVTFTTLLLTSLAAPAEPAAGPDARDIFFAMTDTLAAAPGVSVSIRSGFDVVQSSGQKVQFLENRQLALARPSRLRLDTQAGEGRQELLLFDGKTMTVLDYSAGVYAQVPQPGSVDDAIVYFVRDLQMRLPLAALLTSQATAELSRQLARVEIVERTDVLGTPAYHLAGRMRDVDFQVWIADSDAPLPLRIVLTYPEPGLPQFWAEFSDWNVRTEPAAARFMLELPSRAKQVAFAAQLKPVPEDGVAAGGGQ